MSSARKTPSATVKRADDLVCLPFKVFHYVVDSPNFLFLLMLTLPADMLEVEGGGRKVKRKGEKARRLIQELLIISVSN